MQTAVEFLAWSALQGPWETWTGAQRTKRKQLFKALPAEEQYKVNRGEIEDYFVPANKAPKDEQVFNSPSEKYKLVVTAYGTKPGAWNYARGKVYRISDGQLVADVKRNYSSFPFMWLEQHIDGHDYLICGEDYQGQTFCQLDTAQQKSYLPIEAYDGAGFCWADYKLLDDKRTLLVEGCYWACPYEYRLYDISDIMQGWPELTLDVSLELNSKTSVVTDGDKIIWTETEKIFKATQEREREIEIKRSLASRAALKAGLEAGKTEQAATADATAAFTAVYEEYPEEDEHWDAVPYERVVLKRAGNVLEIVEHWKSANLLKQEMQQAAWREKSIKERKQWMDDSELLQTLAKEVGSLEQLRKQLTFSYPSGHMRAHGEKNSAFFHVSARAYDPDVSYNHNASLEWGVETGDIKLRLEARNQKAQEHTFPRNVVGIFEAWQAAKMHLAAEH
jgi:hypothetical protein